MTAVIEKCAFDEENERQLFMLELSTPEELPAHVDLHSPNFGCVLAWNACDTTTEEVAALVEPLIKAGCVYFSCWGPDCERVHDIIDECDPYTESVIMTTWHEKVPIEEALWYFLNCTWPDDEFRDSFRASIAITVGSREWAATARGAVNDPKTFTQAVSDGETGHKLFAKP